MSKPQTTGSTPFVNACSPLTESLVKQVKDFPGAGVIICASLPQKGPACDSSVRFYGPRKILVGMYLALTDDLCERGVLPADFTTVLCKKLKFKAVKR